jgi:stage V sporulation protein R
MNRKDILRFERLDEIFARMLENKGLLCTEDIIWKFEAWIRMVEAMAYHFPTNYSSIFHGRDFDLIKMKYVLTGEGLPYEAVWNFHIPVAMMAKENSFALNLLINPHVRGHIDFNLRNSFMIQGRELADIAEEARLAATRFDEYRATYGDKEVDRIIAIGDSLSKYQNPNRLTDEEETEEDIRKKFLDIEQEKLKTANVDFGKSAAQRQEAAAAAEKRIKELKKKTPPRPVFDILGYIMTHCPKEHEPWAYDIWNVQLHQAKHQQRVMVCHMLNEGWASYWHEYAMHELFRKKLIDSNEFGIFTDFHSKVCRPSRFGFNAYHIGPAFYADIMDRWDKGQFGREYMECMWPHKRERYIRKGFEGAGEKKIFEIASTLNDRMAYSNAELFSDEFIAEEGIYIWGGQEKNDGSVEYTIAEKNPEVMRYVLTNRATLYGIPLMSVQDGNYNGNKELYLRHHFMNYELDPKMESGAMEHVWSAWGKPVHLETVEITKRDDQGRPQKSKSILHTYDGKTHKFK